MAQNQELADAAQAALDAVEEFYDSGCRDSFMVKERSGDTYRAMRNSWMVARSLRSVAQGSGGGFVGYPSELLGCLRRISSFVEMASRTESDSARTRHELQTISATIDSVQKYIPEPERDRHILGEWIAAVREVDAVKEQVSRRQEVFDRQIERWENVGRTTFGASKPYEAEAGSAKKRAIGWAIGAGVLAALTVGFGFSLDLSGGETGRTLGDALYASAGRWVGFAVLISAVTWCGRRASANAHLAAIARDRASAWGSYHTLLASGGQSSDAAMALAKKLFETPATGYLAKAAPSSVPSLPFKLGD